MTKMIYAAVLALLLGAVPVAVNAAITIAGETVWVGIWSTEDGATIYIVPEGGYLEIVGEDKASTFKVTCVLGAGRDIDRSAECIGHGTNHGLGVRFLYKSVMSNNEKGQITEVWQADFWHGSPAKRASKKGIAVFKRQKSQ